MERHFSDKLSRVLSQGNLSVRFPSGLQQSYGDGTGPHVAVALRDDRTIGKILSDPPLALPEAYVDEGLIVEDGDIYDFLAMLKCNGIHRMATPRAVLHHLRRTALSWLHQRAGLSLARRQIAHHYDLDERLFRLFLDEDMNYSCAYFEHEGQSLEEAQRAKQRHITAKLLSHPGGRVLDIGCGWGGLGLYMAQTAGLDVTGITLSTEQQRVATERAQALGLQGQARFRLQDYRSVTGQYDHITSVGMLEHVGLPQLKRYFRAVARLLDKKGTAVIHSMAQPRPQPYAQPFGDKYIFPGGYIPSLGQILPAVEAAGLLVKDIEVLPLHYAQTTNLWRQRFLANRAQAAALFDERFVRMWEVYLVGAEIGFRIDRIFVTQLQLARHQDRVPIRRDWMAKERAALILGKGTGGNPQQQLCNICDS